MVSLDSLRRLQTANAQLLMQGMVIVTKAVISA
jgi:hypothetical protein